MSLCIYLQTKKQSSIYSPFSSVVASIIWRDVSGSSAAKLFNMFMHQSLNVWLLFGAGQIECSGLVRKAASCGRKQDARTRAERH